MQYFAFPWLDDGLYGYGEMIGTSGYVTITIAIASLLDIYNGGGLFSALLVGTCKWGKGSDTIEITQEADAIAGQDIT